MQREICRQCPKLRLCENDPKECDRNIAIGRLIKQEIIEVLEDLHRVFTQIEDDGDE